MGGVELSMTAAALTDAGHDKKFPITDGRAQFTAARAEANSQVLCRARILWVDDRPGNNVVERRLMRNLGVWFDLALNTGEALDRLGHGDYDVVISDWGRAEDPHNGAGLAELMHEDGMSIPVIIYNAGVKESFHDTPRRPCGDYAPRPAPALRARRAHPRVTVAKLHTLGERFTRPGPGAS